MDLVVQRSQDLLGEQGPSALGGVLHAGGDRARRDRHQPRRRQHPAVHRDCRSSFVAGPEPPKLICVDPRETPVARAGTVHLAPLPGTNVALMNGILHEIIRNDWVDHDYSAAHTVGYEELSKQVEGCPPEWAAEICQIPAERIRGRPYPGHRSAAAVHRVAGLLPIPSGDRGGCAGQ